MENSSILEIGKGLSLSLLDFHDVVYGDKKVAFDATSLERVLSVRKFIDYLLENKVKVYGITTGFADLRDQSVSAEETSQLSINLIHSHDAGIGKPLRNDVVLGGMLIRANSLAKGYSGFKPESFTTLIGMINAGIIPEIPCAGSLGASGDLAYFARLGMAMMGKDVPVYYEGTKTTARHALSEAGISPFRPGAKEGLALTNGTSFMASMLSIAYLKQLHEWENILAMQALFLNAIGCVDGAFSGSIQEVRQQRGQSLFAGIIRQLISNSPFGDSQTVQNDYCIRCLPQIFGPKIDLFLDQFTVVNQELNAVTDNPIIFKNEEISSDVKKENIFSFDNSCWAVISGGNFHGEYMTSVADCLAMANAKIALTMERQLTYVLNPARNKQKLPVYLISDHKKSGLLSGYMITQYTANALTQKICQLGMPASIFNITSANESEDIVSYGATAGQRILEQLDLLHELNVIYLTTMTQAYAITRNQYLKRGSHLESALISEKIFRAIEEKTGKDFYPTATDEPFAARYALMDTILSSTELRKIIAFPLRDYLNLAPKYNQVFDLCYLA